MCVNQKRERIMGIWCYEIGYFHSFPLFLILIFGIYQKASMSSSCQRINAHQIIHLFNEHKRFVRFLSC